MRVIQSIIDLEVVSSHLRRPLRRKGTELSSDDVNIVMDTYQQWMCLLYDLRYLPPETVIRDSTRLLNDMLDKDVYDLVSALTEMSDKIRRQTIRGFKGLCKRVSSHLYNIVKCDLNEILKGSVPAARRLIQLFSYMSRLSLKDIDLTAECLNDYLETEENIASDYPDGLLSDLNVIIRRWLANLDLTELSFRHGNGAVADAATYLDSKYSALMTDAMISYVIGDRFVPLRDSSCQLLRQSQTRFVPKSYKTFRTISFEPATLMYLQQGVWQKLSDYVSKHKYLRSHIGFDDQLRNGQLAIEGSLSRNYATLDLSAASDSVSYVLVKSLFKGTPLIPYLMATRSRTTLLPDARIITLKKFAPMGSALCFPVETMIFAAMCEYVTRCHGVAGRYSVYGDDIIVPTECAHLMSTVLSQCGFNLNKAKSFFSEASWFRESCGIEAINGEIVTPIRVSRRYTGKSDGVSMSQLVEKANQALLYEFFYLRSWLIRKIQKSYNVLFGPTSLHGFEETNFHLPKRWNSDLQRLEVRVTTFTKRPQTGVDSIGYRHWLETTASRHLDDSLGYIPYPGDADFMSMTGRPTMERRREVWVAKPYHRSDQPVIERLTRTSRNGVRS